MQRLAQADLAAVLDWLRELYAETDLRGLANLLVNRLGEIVPTDVTSYNEIDLEGRTIEWISSHDLLGTLPEADTILLEHMEEHPLISYASMQPDRNLPHAVKISDLLPDREWHRIGIYNEFFRALDLEDQLAIGMTGVDGRLVGIAMNRSGGQFSEGERALLDIVRPHVAQAYRTAAALTEAQWQQDALTGALEESGAGVVLLDHVGRVHLITSSARMWLAGYFSPRLRNHEEGQVLPPQLRRWVRHQLALLAVHDDVPPPLAPLVVRRDGRRLAGRLVPRDERGCTVMILEERIDAIGRVEASAPGLTRRQLEIVALAAQGKTNLEIGEALSISVHTVRRHMEEIYGRLGIRNRAELTRHVLGGSIRATGPREGATSDA